MAVAEKQSNNVNETLLSLYSQDQEIYKLICEAASIEEEFADGLELMDGYLYLKALINEDTGMWELCLEADHGRVFYTAKDLQMTKINIATMPNTKYIRDKEVMNDGDLALIQKEFSRSFDIDLKDVKTLNSAKKFFQGDYVLKNIQLYNEAEDTAERFMIWHIRAYRKVYVDHYKAFNSLWEGSGLKSAKSLLKAMKDRGLTQ